MFRTGVRFPPAPLITKGGNKMAEVTVTEQNFQKEVIESDIPVIVDFWATWCGPCMMLGPVLKEIAEENEGKIKVCKINVDENQGLAMMFRIDTIPAFMVFKNGKQTNAARGYMEKAQVLSLLND